MPTSLERKILMTNRLNVAIFIEQKIQIGGGFKQSLISALQIRDLKFDILNLRFIVTDKDNVNLLKKYKKQQKRC